MLLCFHMFETRVLIPYNKQLPNKVVHYFDGTALHWTWHCPYSEIFWYAFSPFGLNTEIYSVSLRIQSKYGKIRTRKTPNTDTFYAVWIVHNHRVWEEAMSELQNAWIQKVHNCFRSQVNNYPNFLNFHFRETHVLNYTFIRGITAPNLLNKRRINGFVKYLWQIFFCQNN